jgi:hypothetical protein
VSTRGWEPRARIEGRGGTISVRAEDIGQPATVVRVKLSVRAPT